MTMLPHPAGDAMPWLVRKLRPAALAVLLSAVLCSGAVLAALTVFLVAQTTISEERP